MPLLLVTVFIQVKLCVGISLMGNPKGVFNIVLANKIVPERLPHAAVLIEHLVNNIVFRNFTLVALHYSLDMLVHHLKGCFLSLKLSKKR